MLMKVFSARDMKAEAFLQPFFMPTQGSAIRAFGDACEKQDSPFFQHPNDYVLYEIGSYDDSDAMLVALNPVKMLVSAADFKKPDFLKDKVRPENIRGLESNPGEADLVNGKK